MCRFIFCLALILFSRSAAAYSQVLVSEIMYDVQGSDAKREWIEVYNTGDTTLNFTSWKLFEKDTNHEIRQFKGSAVLSPGAYAVVASNGESFMGDHPGYAGVLYTSSFSLSNDGETLGLKDSSLNIVHQVSYDNTAGAAGDGNSLQKSDGAWRVAPPTPGDANVETVQEHDSALELQKASPATLRISGDPIAGETLTFVSDAQTTNGQTCTWNFGDGTMLKDDGEFRIEHVFDFAGTYVTIFDCPGVLPSTPVYARLVVNIADRQPVTETVDVIVPIAGKTEHDSPADGVVLVQSAEGEAIPKIDTDVKHISVTSQAAQTIQADTPLWPWMLGLAVCIAVAVVLLRIRYRHGEATIPSNSIEIID